MSLESLVIRFQSMVARAQALPVAHVRVRPAVFAFLDVIGVHPEFRRGVLAALPRDDPFAAATGARDDLFAPRFVPLRIIIRVDLFLRRDGDPHVELPDSGIEPPQIGLAFQSGALHQKWDQSFLTRPVDVVIVNVNL